MNSTTTTLSVELPADEANAVVYALALELVCAGTPLDDAHLSTSPGDLADIAKHTRRISRLAEINEQLAWRAHWGPIGGQPPAITAPEDVLLEIAMALQKRADEVVRYRDEEGPKFPFGQAARTIARAFASEPVAT